MNLEALTYGLIGSAATVICTQLFTNYNKKKEFEREIAKATFLRKLEIAEKATAFLSDRINDIQSLLIAFSHVNLALKNKQFHIKQDIAVEAITKGFKKLEEKDISKEKEFLAAQLYFDFSDDSWKLSDSQAIINCYTNLISVGEKMDYWRIVVENNPNFEQAKINLEQEVNDFSKLLDEMLNLFEKNIATLKNIVTDMKDQARTI